MLHDEIIETTPESGRFSPADLEAPLDVDAYLAEIPPESVTKGMFFDPLRNEVRRSGKEPPGRDRYLPFRDYPMPEYLEVVLQCSELLQPGTPPREALRRAGRLVYPTFADTLIGRVLFKFAGSNVDLVLKAVPRAYSRVNPNCSATVRQSEEGFALVEIRGVWDVPEVSQVGIWEGGLEVLGLDGEVLVQPISPCDCDLQIRWQR